MKVQLLTRAMQYRATVVNLYSRREEGISWHGDCCGSDSSYIARRRYISDKISAADQVVIEAVKEPRLPLVHINYNTLIFKKVEGEAHLAWCSFMQTVQNGKYLSTFCLRLTLASGMCCA